MPEIYVKVSLGQGYKVKTESGTEVETFWISPEGNFEDGSFTFDEIQKKSYYNFEGNIAIYQIGNKLQDLLFDEFGKSQILQMNNTTIKYQIYQLDSIRDLKFSNVMITGFRIIGRDGTIMVLSKKDKCFKEVNSGTINMNDRFLSLSSEFAWQDSDISALGIKIYDDCNSTQNSYEVRRLHETCNNFALFDHFIQKAGLDGSDIVDVQYSRNNVDNTTSIDIISKPNEDVLHPAYKKNKNGYYQMSNFYGPTNFEWQSLIHPIPFKEYVKEYKKDTDTLFQKIKEDKKLADKLAESNNTKPIYHNCYQTFRYYHRNYFLNREYDYNTLNHFERFLICVHDYLIDIGIADMPNCSTYTGLGLMCKNNKDFFFNDFLNKQIEDIKKEFKSFNFTFSINELTRKYYGMNNRKKPYFTIFINYYIDNIIKPAIDAGVDIKEKYGITPNNMTNILFKV